MRPVDQLTIGHHGAINREVCEGLGARKASRASGLLAWLWLDYISESPFLEMEETS